MAIVIGYHPGDQGRRPSTGNGYLTAFSVVEVRTDEYLADTHPSRCAIVGICRTERGELKVALMVGITLGPPRISFVPTTLGYVRGPALVPYAAGH